MFFVPTACGTSPRRSPALEWLFESHTLRRYLARGRSDQRTAVLDHGWRKPASMRRAVCETKSGKLGGNVGECIRTVTAPAQVALGHHTGADTQQIPGKASWRSVTVAPSSRTVSRSRLHSRGVQQSGSAISPPGCAAYKTRP